MFMRLIYLKYATFLSLKITVDTLIDARNEHITLLFVANVPVRFRAQKQAKYSSRQTVSQLKGVSDTISNRFENRQPDETNFHRQ